MNWGDIPIRIEMLFGRIEMESRMRPAGNRLVGESRSLTYDGDGHLTKDTGWQPTGAVLYWPDHPEPKRWWEFCK